MKRGADQYGRFLRRLPLALAAAMVVWLLARPVFDHATAGMAELLIRAFEYPKVTQLVVENHSAEIHRADFRAGSGIPAYPLTQVHFNAIVLLALYLSLPRPLSKRQLERLIMGWTVLFLIQTLNLGLHVKMIYATALGEWSTHHYSNLARNVYGFLQYFTDLPGRFAAPFLIWLGFNWDQVVELISPESEKSRVRRREKEVRRKG